MLPFQFIALCITTQAVKVTEGDAWAHEIKYGRYRNHICFSGGHAREPSP